MYQGTDFSECFYTVGLMQDVLIYLLFFFAQWALMQDVLIYFFLFA